jgi:UPF0271 protein
VTRFLSDGAVAAEDGTRVELEADSICVHGDGPNAVEVATAVRTAVQSAGHQVRAVG